MRTKIINLLLLFLLWAGPTWAQSDLQNIKSKVAKNRQDLTALEMKQTQAEWLLSLLDADKPEELADLPQLPAGWLAVTEPLVHKHSMVTGGCTGYSFGQTPYTWLTPSEEAALGNVTATITTEATDGTNPLPKAVPSHNLTVVANSTSGTTVGLYWTSAHGVSGTIYETIDNSSTVVATYNVGTSGSSPGWSRMNSATVGHTYHLSYLVTDSNGNTTQDRVNVFVVSGAGPAIVNQDNLPENMYLRVNPNFGGPAMAQSCQICIQQPSACSGAQHTPYISGSLTNNASGEVKTFQKQQAGSIVSENDPISGSAFWDISAMPSDIGDIGASATGEIFCSAVEDDIYQSLISWRIEYAKVIVKDLGHPGRPSPQPPAGDGSTIYDVAAICDNNSDPSDWQPTVVHSFSGRHPYWWGVTSLFRAPDINGMTWFPLSSFLTDFTPEQGILKLAKMVIEGGAVPYPGGSGPDFPVPGACTQFVGFDENGKAIKNVILTLGSKAVPWWPFNN